MSGNTESTGVPTNPSGGRPPGAMTNAAWNAFSTLSGMVISFVLAPLLIHNMGTAEYGVLLLVWSVTGILGVVNIGVGEATLRYVAHYYHRGEMPAVNRVMGATLSLMSAVCVVVLMGFGLATPWAVKLFNFSGSDPGLAAWLLRCSAVIVSLSVFSWIYAAVPMALHRYDIVSKITVVQSVVRSAGYILLAVNKFGILHLVLWDIVTQAITLWVNMAVVRNLSPQIKLLPSLSFKGLREILGFSIWSFLTYLFLMFRRESAKIVLGAQLGPTAVAHLGTPDNLAHRIHMVVASGSETLLPRFSAAPEKKSAQTLFSNGTWASLVTSLVFLLPLVVLMPGFLRLWISPEFAEQSATVGQLVALGYIFHGAYAPTATYFRGIGKPWLVTLVTAVAGCVILLFSFLLIPRYGVVGVGYAYLLGSVPALLGLLHGWFHIFGLSSFMGLMRVVGLPLFLAGTAAAVQQVVLGLIPELTWFWLFTLGAAFVSLSGLLIFGADLALGGDDPPSKQFVDKLRNSNKVVFVLNRLPWKRFHCAKAPRPRSSAL